MNDVKTVEAKSDLNPILYYLERYLEGMANMESFLNEILNMPVVLEFIDGVSVIIREVIIMVGKVRFYDYPSTNAAIRNTILK